MGSEGRVVCGSWLPRVLTLSEDRLGRERGVCSVRGDLVTSTGSPSWGIGSGPRVGLGFSEKMAFVDEARGGQAMETR